MSYRLLVPTFAGICAIPLLAQQLRLGSAPGKPTPHPINNAVRSFVKRNANLPAVKKMPEKLPDQQVPSYRQLRNFIASKDVCSVPLTNVAPPAPRDQLNMPVVTPPRNLDRMPNVQVPAPQCTGRPPK